MVAILNSQKSASTGKSPYYSAYGREWHGFLPTMAPRDTPGVSGLELQKRMAKITNAIIAMNENRAEQAEMRNGRFSTPLKPGDNCLVLRPLSAQARQHGTKVKWIPGYRVIKALDQVTKLENVGNGLTDYVSNAHIRLVPPRPKHLEEDSLEFIPESGGAEVIPGKSYADATRPKTRSINQSRASSKSGKRPVQKPSRKRAPPIESSPIRPKRVRKQTIPFQATMSGQSHD